MWSVYKHTSPSDKVYIGITSREPSVRWANGKGYKNNPYFWSAICKYGWENIKHEILFDNLTEEQAQTIERQLIAEYDSTNRTKGYNHDFGGKIAPLHCDEVKQRIGLSGLGRTPWNKGLTGELSHSYGRTLSEETKHKIGAASKGRTHSIESREKNRQKHLGKHYRTQEGKEKQSKRQSIAVSQFTLDGEYIATYNSAREAYKATGVVETHICSCRSGKRKTACGFIWRYADQTNQQEVG